MIKTTKKKITMEIAMNDPRNKGYHLIVVAGKLFKAKTGEGALKILEEVDKKFPKATPEITYIPKAQSLILWI
ncbi:hypothetical protein COT44_02675 [Candidatus Shapirobacteria bacterium CG08_land_8_20_14_0_20_39_18]|uniref:DUF5678 domain-containing protein n=1 Tax=Candidatus Shapirobacteria bacterium CG08_land_8_20_14_0_20_39_18 TaxID=1974883 RepID=A0A2M6XCU8_9BACT|nr:MAG: hypothetical protein COT44_02675 [Candidatus Shapirobacteria bacterium CG08_land_8_20_14_0_20_39_18]PJE68171.1 MAG: hypothetical protein COU94_03335 [Candidatus Shapirobacteria bacterium CG10_big_fil_rev_8_21_14_0_10_38_8]